MEVIKDILRKKGTFKVLYTNKAGIFGGGKNNSFAVKRQNFSQLEERLETFGINVIHTNSPEAKGRVHGLGPCLRLRTSILEAMATTYIS